MFSAEDIGKKAYADFANEEARRLQAAELNSLAAKIMCQMPACDPREIEYLVIRMAPGHAMMICAALEMAAAGMWQDPAIRAN